MKAFRNLNLPEFMIWYNITTPFSWYKLRIDELPIVIILSKIFPITLNHRYQPAFPVLSFSQNYKTKEKIYLQSPEGSDC